MCVAVVGGRDGEIRQGWAFVDSETEIPSARAQYCLATQIAGWVSYIVGGGGVRMLVLICQLGQWDGMLISGRVGGFDPERQIPRECTWYWFSIERAWRGE